MKTLANHLLVTTIIVVLNSCFLQCEDDPIPVREDKISMEIERTSSRDNFKANVLSYSVLEKLSGWHYNIDSTVDLTRETQLQLLTDNGDTMTFSFFFIKRNEDASLLKLSQENNNYWKRNWDYTDFEDEINYFYHDFDEARILVDHGHSSYYTEENDNFNIVTAEEVVVDGTAKTYLTIEFSGNVYGIYDPYGEFQEYYILRNGIFQGFIE